jgi:hypothetical protein
MKSNALASLLTGAVIVCALTLLWISTRYFFAMREMQKLQGQYSFMNNTRAAAQGLANEALEYSKRNPAIDSILYQYDVKQRPATNAPAARPAAK